MAMACRPDLIIFDEPTTALDVTTQIEVLAAIRDIVAQFDTAAHLHHPRPGGGGADGRPHHGAAPRQAGRGGRRPAQMLATRSEAYTKSLWAVAHARTRSRGARRRDRCCAVRSVDAAYGAGQGAARRQRSTCHRGRTVAVVGESGSGKSTLARVITGLLPPAAGEVLLRRQAAAAGARAAAPRTSCAGMQMIYQMPDTALNPRQRVRESSAGRSQFYLGPAGPALRAARPRAAAS